MNTLGRRPLAYNGKASEILFLIGYHMDIQYPDYEAKTQMRISRYTIWVTMIACVAFGVFNIDLSSWSSVAAILTAAGLCLVALLANYRNHVMIANLLVCSSVLLAITYSIYDGDGLLDPGIVGYPLFILIGTMLLSKRYTIWLTLAAILSLSTVGFMQANGSLHLTIHTNDARNLIPIIIFLVVGSLVVWVILDNQDKNFQMIRESEEDLRKSYDLTIQGLSAALEMRDVGTGGHSHRVVELTEKLARRLEIPEKEITSYRYGAYLHDIGKIGIPDAILLKKVH